jgi:hypothetical protein
MGRILLFNPSHEMALATNAAQYTPPKQIQQMEEDLCRLPLLWAEEGDIVLTSTSTKTSTLHSSLFTLNSPLPAPWGWNKSVRNRFLRMGIDPSLMPSEQQLDCWRSFASRAWAADYCDVFYRKCEVEGLVPNHVAFIRSNADYEAWLSKYGSVPFIVKAEYSSSGRGNRVFNVQGSRVQEFKGLPQLIDTFYDKMLDFAMEFEVTRQAVRYLGLSVFETSSEGRYAFNYLRSQQELREMIVSQLLDANVLDDLIAQHLQLLSERLLGQYEGIVGIDMMVVRGGLIHPCVEINLRMNMGVVAMKLYEKGLTSLSRSLYGGQFFYPVIEDGKFFIAYTSNTHSGQ